MATGMHSSVYVIFIKSPGVIGIQVLYENVVQNFDNFGIKNFMLVSTTSCAPMRGVVGVFDFREPILQMRFDMFLEATRLNKYKEVIVTKYDGNGLNEFITTVGTYIGNGASKPLFKWTTPDLHNILMQLKVARFTKYLSSNFVLSVSTQTVPAIQPPQTQTQIVTRVIPRQPAVTFAPPPQDLKTTVFHVGPPPTGKVMFIDQAGRQYIFYRQ